MFLNSEKLIGSLCWSLYGNDNSIETTKPTVCQQIRPKMSKIEKEIKPVMANNNIVIQEEKPFFILCKPKLLPLKSMTLEKLEKMQTEAEEKAKQLMAQNVSQTDL